MALTKVTDTLLSSGVGTSANNLVELDGSGKLPAVDGSLLTGIDSLPTQASQSGKYLTTNGTTATWSTIAQGSFPFYKRDGTLDKINLTSDSKVPFFKDTGTASNIALTI